MLPILAIPAIVLLVSNTQQRQRGKRMKQHTRACWAKALIAAVENVRDVDIQMYPEFADMENFDYAKEARGYLEFDKFRCEHE